MKVRYKIFNLIVAFLLIAIAVGNAFAWFTSKSISMNISGASSGAYFAYGTGKAGDPYGITEPAHLYNLAWLQNKEKIDPGTYFELDADIEMPADYVLPPIGNADNPFKSIFNGNGHKITNLVISTNKNVLRGNPADSNYAFSNAVGMFGMTAPNNIKDSETEIKNFILVNPTVEVADIAGGQDTAYDTAEDNTKKAVGLAIGYVDCKASSIGVWGGKYVVRRESTDTPYKTFNSILGAMSAEAEKNNSITGGNNSTSSKSETGIILPSKIYQKLILSNYTTSDTDYETVKRINDTFFTTSEYSPNTKLGDVRFKSGLWIHSSATNNFLGLGSISFSTHRTSDTVRIRHDSTRTYFTYTDNTNSSTYDVYLSNAPEGHIVSDNEKKVKDKIVDLDGTTQLTSLDYNFYIQNAATLDSSTTYTVYNSDATLYQDANKNTYENAKLQIYDSTIKVHVITDSATVLVVARANSGTNNVGIYKIDDTDGDYSKPETFLTNSESRSSDNTLSFAVGSDKLYATEFDLSKKDGKFGQGSYLIATTSGGINFYYIKISGVETGQIKDTGELGTGLSAIDFIYEGVKIKQPADKDPANIASGNFIDGNALYSASQVRVYYSSITATLYISFERIKSGTSVTFTVQYNGQIPDNADSNKYTAKGDLKAFKITVNGVVTGT